MFKTAIITGASQGIGYAIAAYLAQHDYELLLISRNLEKLERAAEQIKKDFPQAKIPMLVAMDVADFDAAKACIDAFLAKVKYLSILCNNAGYAKSGTSSIAQDEFMKMINTNLIGTYNFIHHSVPYMKQQKHGKIINIISRSGKFARPNVGAYAASKFGALGFSEGCYKELVPYNISVTALCPGWVDTEMTDDLKIDKNDMIQTQDIVQVVDCLLKLSPTAFIPEIIIEPRAMFPKLE